MKIGKNVSLKKYSTFKIGGPAKWFCEVKTKEELEEALKWAGEKKERYFILGGGSNVLFMDNGFDGLVIKVMNDGLEMISENKNQITIEVGAGALLSRLVSQCMRDGLTGMEWAVGIPGTVGGAVRGNAGAFGGETKDSVKKVIFWDKEWKTFNCSNCQFEYRSSWFKRNAQAVIWSCLVELKKGDQREIEKQMGVLMTKREEKQPQLFKEPSAGSVFQNLTCSKELIGEFERDKEIKCKDEKVPAGWLIERVGLKGKRIGGAMISEKQANFIVNLGGATAEEVITLMSLMKMKVRNKFGVQLKEEVQVVG